MSLVSTPVGEAEVSVGVVCLILSLAGTLFRRCLVVNMPKDIDRFRGFAQFPSRATMPQLDPWMRRAAIVFNLLIDSGLLLGNAIGIVPIQAFIGIRGNARHSSG